MQGRKRFLAALLCLFTLFMVLPRSSFAAEEGQSGYRVVIDDEADLLTAEEEEQLRSVMEQVLPYGNAAFVSVDQNPTTTDDLAESKFTEFFGNNSGVLLIIDMQHRYIRLAADGEIYKTVNDTRCNEIADNVYPYASQQDYYTCAVKAFEQATRILKGGRIIAPFRYVTNAFLAVCLALLGNFALTSIQRRKKIAPENALNVKVAVNTAGSAVKSAIVAGVVLKMLSQRKTKHVESSSGGRSGGGFSGGGHSGGGGGFSGGGGGHRF